MRKIVGWLVTVIFATVVHAETVSPESVGLSSERLQRITELMQENIAAGNISGAVTLVARHGKIAHLEATGVMDLESGRPMEADTYFRLASMSKPVGGLAIMMLVEEGKVRINDPVSRYLPSYSDQVVAVAKSDNPDDGFFTVPAEREITIKDLLTHTSGVMSGRFSGSVGRELSVRRHEDGLAWVDELGKAPLDFQPGSRWSYSALAGFDVLSRIVEIASGQNFNDFLRSRVFGPLEMDDTFFWPNSDQRQNLVSSYSLGDEGLQPRNNPDSMSSPVYYSAAGGLMSSAESYAQFAMLLAGDGELNGARLLGTRTMEVMRSEWIPDSLPGRNDGEGYGLSVRVVTDPIAMGSLLNEGTFGWSGAYGTHLIVDPVEDIVALMFIQTPIRSMRPEFERAVMQAIVD
ncbi:MAG: serine hydrolase [Gammaproteobacteria bacterium]|nr:serine hydrolase [Gammaproteobacteria bacterium]